MDAIGCFLRAEMEPLQYAAFFGALVAFGMLELVFARTPRPPGQARRWSANAALTIINVAVIGAIPLSGVAAADYASREGIGLLNMVSLSSVAAVTLGLLLRSLVAWVTHYAMHKIPVLWRLHRVHHADPFIDVSTTVRFHPGEFLIGTPVLVASVIVLGLPPVALMMFEIVDAMMAVFTHANIRIPSMMNRTLRLILITPDLHRIHHSTRQIETDSNFGATLSIWDRLFGTYRETASEPVTTMPVGLSDIAGNDAVSIGRLLALPIRWEQSRR